MSSRAKRFGMVMIKSPIPTSDIHEQLMNEDYDYRLKWAKFILKWFRYHRKEDIIKAGNIYAQHVMEQMKTSSTVAPFLEPIQEKRPYLAPSDEIHLLRH